MRVIEVKHARELSRKLRALAPKMGPVRWTGETLGSKALDGFGRGQAHAFREAARMIDALPRVRKRMGRVRV